MKPFSRSERLGILTIVGIALAVLGIGVWLRFRPSKLPEGDSTPQIEVLYVDSVAMREDAPKDSIRAARITPGRRDSIRHNRKRSHKKAKSSGKRKSKAPEKSPRDPLSEPVPMKGR